MKVEDLPKPIFDLSREDWKYKGIIEGELDCMKMFDFPCMVLPRNYEVEFWAIIYTDENDIWHLRGRNKFPSGSKQSFSKEFGKDCKPTDILSFVNSMFPFKRVKWHRNDPETGDALLELMKREDLILHMTTVKLDEETK